MDPTIVGIKRHHPEGTLPENRERVVVDAQLSPFAREHFELLSRWAGPPSPQQLAPIPDDLAAGELVLKDQILFGGLQDSRPPLDTAGGLVLPVGKLRDLLVGYLGSSGQIGLLGLLNVQILRRPDEQGYSSNLLGLWRRQIGQFTVFSLHPEVLSAVTPQLRFQPAERPAQLRLRVDGGWPGSSASEPPGPGGSPTNASRRYPSTPATGRVTGLLNNLGYTRTRETSLGNLRLMNDLAQQLHVPPKDCREAAERLLGAKLICPLGGQYVFKDDPEHPQAGTPQASAPGRWTSTALAGSRGGFSLGQQAPPGYQAPPLSWFRGLKLEVTMTEQLFSAHAEVVMELPAKK